MKRFNALRTGELVRVAALIIPLLFGCSVSAYAASAGEHGEEEHGGPGEVIMHHILDSNVMAFEPFAEFELPKIVIGGFDISITRHVVFMWIAAVILLLVFGYVEKHMPYLLTVFVFILLLNLLGLIPYGAAATGNISVTLTLAVFTFFITQVSAIKANGIKGYLAHLTAGTHWALWIIMIPIEVIGLFAKPFALTVRLFANMTAGHIIILSLIFISFILHSYIVAVFVSVPFAIFIYLIKIFVSFLQAFIFTMLSALFIGLASSHENHEAEAAH